MKTKLFFLLSLLAVLGFMPNHVIAQAGGGKDPVPFAQAKKVEVEKDCWVPPHIRLKNWLSREKAQPVPAPTVDKIAAKPATTTQVRRCVGTCVQPKTIKVYVDRPVEKIVEKIVEVPVDRIVEVPVPYAVPVYVVVDPGPTTTITTDTTFVPLTIHETPNMDIRVHNYAYVPNIQRATQTLHVHQQTAVPVIRSAPQPIVRHTVAPQAVQVRQQVVQAPVQRVQVRQAVQQPVCNVAPQQQVVQRQAGCAVQQQQVRYQQQAVRYQQPQQRQASGCNTSGCATPQQGGGQQQAYRPRQVILHGVQGGSRRIL